MKALADHLGDYLSVRRQLGYVLRNDEYALRSFLRFCDQAGHATITTDAVIEWVTAPAGASRSWLAKRFSVVRLFALHAHGDDPAHQIPPARLFTGNPERRTPFLYTDADVVALINAAGTLNGELRPVTHQTLIGLLAATGMRISEAIALENQHVDLGQGLITIRNSKFNKSRQLPLHATTVDALAGYVTERNRHFPNPTEDAGFFTTDNRRRIHYRQCQACFSQCVDRAGLGTTTPRPVLHDLRHSFAVNTLIDWYSTDADVQAMWPYLSTYLGHVEPKSTYWYLTASPQLAAVVAGRLDDLDEVNP